MAAALLTHLSGGRAEVRSAGSALAETVNPAVIEAMAEVGIDLSAEVPKMLTVDAVQASDIVITMGCGDACPVFGIWTGSSTTQPVRASMRSARSGKGSKRASAVCSPNSFPRSDPSPVHQL